MVVSRDYCSLVLFSDSRSAVGKLTCLEEGCNRMEMALTRSRSIPDGGKKIGIGSLSVYRVCTLISTVS